MRWMLVVCVLGSAAACSGVASAPPRPFPVDGFDAGFGGSSNGGFSGSSGGGGSSTSSTGGLGVWAPVPSPTGLRLHAVTGSTGTPVAVGENGVILEFRNGFWSKVPSPTSETLWAVASNGGETWAVGNNGTAVVSNGASWTLVTMPTTQPLNGVRLYGSDVTIVGGRAGGPGIILERQGATTMVDRTPPGTPALFGVGGAEYTAWAIAEDGRVLTRESAGWSEYGRGSGTGLLRIAGHSFRALAVGLGGQARLYDNANYSVNNVVLPSNAPLLGIGENRVTGDIWVCGEDGTILHARDQAMFHLTEFEGEQLPEPVRLWGIAVLYDGTVVAVGDNGAIWMRD